MTKLTVEKLKEKLKFVDKWNEDWKKKPKYLQEKLKEDLKSIETFEPNELQHKRNSVGHQHARLDKEISQPVAICFDTEGRMYVSTFKGTICHRASFKPPQPEGYSHYLSSAQL